MTAPASTIQVDELAPQAFALTVTFEGQSFACGRYLSRAAALQAGRLFVQRKEGEAASGRQRSRKKAKS
jgi:hypothetical protein